MIRRIDGKILRVGGKISRRLVPCCCTPPILKCADVLAGNYKLTIGFSELLTGCPCTRIPMPIGGDDGDIFYSSYSVKTQNLLFNDPVVVEPGEPWEFLVGTYERYFFGGADCKTTTVVANETGFLTMKIECVAAGIGTEEKTRVRIDATVEEPAILFEPGYGTLPFSGGGEVFFRERPGRFDQVYLNQITSCSTTSAGGTVGHNGSVSIAAELIEDP